MLKPHAPAAPRAVAAQIIQLKKLHRVGQLLQIFFDLLRLHYIIHNADAEFHACNHTLNLPRVGNRGVAPNGIFRFDLGQAGRH